MKHKVYLYLGDITTSTDDAIVNAANEDLLAGGGVCGAIFRAAGYADLQRECDRIGHCPTGEAVITKGYHLKAKYVIHAVGPIYQGKKSEIPLYQAYFNALLRAHEKELESIAFPSISTGIYGYPVKDASMVAFKAVEDFFTQYPSSSIRKVDFYAFDRETYDVLMEHIVG